jgi:hypothetical protein
MYFKRMVDKLFNRQRNKSRTGKKGSKENINVIISSNWMENDEIKPSPSTPSRLQVEDEETFYFGDIKTAEEESTDTDDLSTDSSLTLEQLWSRSEENKIVVKEGPKRPFLLRPKAAAISRPPTLAERDQMSSDKFKQNLLNRSLAGSRGSKSMEYYDDRSPVFGGWSTDTSNPNSCTELCLDNLGSIESYCNYGGDEGAKPFDGLKSTSVSQAKSWSEGLTEEENERPKWNIEDDDLPEVIHLFKGTFSDQSSSSVYRHFPKLSPSVKVECPVHLYASSFQEEGIWYPPPSHDDFLCDLDDCEVLSVIALV